MRCAAAAAAVAAEAFACGLPDVNIDCGWEGWGGRGLLFALDGPLRSVPALNAEGMACYFPVIAKVSAS